MSVNKLLDISRRSLLTYQKALSVTSNNVSNANNPDYSRQRVIFGSEAPDVRTKFSIGSGATIDSIQRITSDITESQIRIYSQDYSASNRESEILSSIEALLSDTDNQGLSAFINEYFDSWDELAVNPTSSALRTNVIQSAQKMSGKLETMYDGMTRIRNNLRSEAREMVNTINNSLEQINTLNKQIYESVANNSQPNDLLDKRDALLSELSDTVNINVSFDKYNVANVSIGGVFAVDRISATEFKLVEENGDIFLGTADDAARVSLQGGEFSAVSNAFNNTIPSYQEELDNIAVAIMDNVNTLHRTGYSLTNPPQTNLDFFSAYDHGVLTINTQILNDVNLISASSQSGQNGNNEIALQLAGLKNDDLMDGLTISETYSALVSQIGNEKRLHEQNAESYNLVLEQLELQKAETSGVSVDEEMVDILKFQRSYDAAARLIRVADELFETLLSSI